MTSTPLDHFHSSFQPGEARHASRPGTVTLTNAWLLIGGEITKGSISFFNGEIYDLHDQVSQLPNAIDCEEDFVLPGLVEVHTDALEAHLRPRQQHWPSRAAVVAHDAVLAGCGITTVLDSLRIGDLGSDGFRPEGLEAAVDAVAGARRTSSFRVDHLLHLRCEVADPRTPELFDRYVQHPLVRLVSLMDHTPGVRQYTDVQRYIGAVLADGVQRETVESTVARLQARSQEYSSTNWSYIARVVCSLGLPLASHDDATLDDVSLALRTGVTLSEFPTTELAADAATTAGLLVAAGAPNIVRGGSHSGNVSAAELARLGLLDIVTSDYVPYSLLHAPFVLAADHGVSLAKALSFVTSQPAAAVGLRDRGDLAVGKRADLIRVRLVDGVPTVRSVWVGGERVG